VLFIEGESFLLPHTSSVFLKQDCCRSSGISARGSFHGSLLSRDVLLPRIPAHSRLGHQNTFQRDGPETRRLLHSRPVYHAARNRDVSVYSTAQPSSEVEKFLEDARVRKVAAWLFFALGCFASREFYGVIVGTFIMAFVGNSFVSFLEQQASLLHSFTQARTSWKIPKPSRKALSILYFFFVLNLIGFATIFTVPQLISSWRYLKQVILSDNPYVELAESIHALIGSDATARLESLLTGVMGSFTPSLRFK
jgi:hypothetical protein